MSDERLLTLRQLAEEIGIPESTVRYYRDAFLDHIPSVGTGRRRRYPTEAIAVLRSIATSYSAGRSRAEIIASIHERPGGPAAAAVAVTAEKAQRAIPLEEVSNLDLLAAILDGEREQRDALWQMAKEIVRLTEVLEGQDKVLNEIADTAGVRTPRLNRAPEPARLVGAPLAGAPETPPPPAPIKPVEPVEPLKAVEPVEAFRPVEAAPLAEPVTMFGESTPPAPRTEHPAPVFPDVDKLREELEAERALVERLRESKLQLEHRAADAEAALEERKGRRSSVIRRLLGDRTE